MTDLVVTLELRVKAEFAEGFGHGLPAMIEQTASRPGFRSIRVVQNKEDATHFLFIENWDSETAYNDYIDWRVERGDMANMSDALITPAAPVFWPTTLATR